MKWSILKEKMSQMETEMLNFRMMSASEIPNMSTTEVNSKQFLYSVS